MSLGLQYKHNAKYVWRITLFCLPNWYTGLGFQLPGDCYLSDYICTKCKEGGEIIYLFLFLLSGFFFVVFFWRGWGDPIVSVKGALNISAYQNIFQKFPARNFVGGNRGMVPSCFNMIVHQCTGLGPWRHGWVKLVWKNLTEPHSFLTSTKRTPLPCLHWRLWARPSRPASVSDLTKVLLEDWPKISINTLPNLMGSLPLSCKGLEDIILNPVDKEYDVTQWLYVCENRQQMAICKIGK